MIEGEVKCPKESIIYDPLRGEYICAETGEVIEEHVVDLGPEWRVFSPEDKYVRSRVGGPVTARVHDLGITTFIDVRRGKLSLAQRRKARKLQLIQKRNRISPSDKKLVEVLAEVNAVAARLGLPDRVKETTAYIMRKLTEKISIRRPQLKNYLAAALYISCKICRIPKTPNEIMTALSVNRRELWYACRRIKELVLQQQVPLIKPIELVPKLASSLGLPAEVQTQAAIILNKASEYNLTDGKGPLGLAAAALYVAAIILDHKRTQKEVAEGANITEVTVRNRYRDIIENFVINVYL